MEHNFFSLLDNFTDLYGCTLNSCQLSFHTVSAFQFMQSILVQIIESSSLLQQGFILTKSY